MTISIDIEEMMKRDEAPRRGIGSEDDVRTRLWTERVGRLGGPSGQATGDVERAGAPPQRG